MPHGVAPTVNVATVPPSAAFSLVTVLPSFVTHRLAPSNAMPHGLVPTAKVAAMPPSDLSLVTLLVLEFVTQILTPSKTTSRGMVLELRLWLDELPSGAVAILLTLLLP